MRSPIRSSGAPLPNSAGAPPRPFRPARAARRRRLARQPTQLVWRQEPPLQFARPTPEAIHRLQSSAQQKQSTLDDAYPTLATWSAFTPIVRGGTNLAMGILFHGP